MSRLKLYAPDQSASRNGNRFAATQETRNILPFPRRYQSRRRVNMLRRARLLRENSRCPHCGHPVVEPLELEDALYSRGNLPIPGTATLVGFHCEACHAEWPASSEVVETG